MPNISTGTLYCGDNLEVLHNLPKESIDLIYIDPPFFTSRNYEVIYGDSREIRAFEDRWKGGIKYYVDWMTRRLALMREVLKPTGSIYVHLDDHAVHYIKVAMDDIFGAANFRNEIIWKRTTSHSDAKRWSPVTDMILYYAKGDKFTWNPQYVAYDESYLESKYRYKDADGRRYRLDNMTSPNPRPNMMYEWKGHESPPKGWRFSKETMAKLDAEGRIWYPQDKNKRPQIKRYLDEMPGMLASNLWTDIPPLNSQAKERQGYPTQKPETLLARIISASSNSGDVVADFFAGCGTTLSVAQQLQRRWIGCDVSPTALRVVEQRLRRLGAIEVKMENFPYSLEELKQMNPFEFQNYVVDFIQGLHSPRKSGDYGIDGFTWWNRYPVQVKQQEGVGRPVIQAFASAVRKENKDKGYVFALGFTRTAHEETARLRQAENLDIQLVEVQKMVDTEPLPEYP